MEAALAKVWTVDAAGALSPLKYVAPLVPSPSDQGIQPTQGDDTKPPNAVGSDKVNRIVGYGQASAGFSSSSGERCLPSSYAYDIRVEDAGEDTFGLTMTVTMEFQNSHPGESMVVWLKRAKQLINDARQAALVLVDTSFEDQVDGRWVKIDTDIRFAAEAEAVARSVMESDSGQTVGRVTSAGAEDDAKLGPVGERGRVVLTYQCEDLYSYAEMSLAQGANLEPRHLVPLAIHLPHAPMDNLGGKADLAVTVRGPPKSRSLDLQANALAVQHLQTSSQVDQSNILLPLPRDVNQSGVEFSFSTAILPPAPTCLLCWLSCAGSSDSEWELVGNMQKLDLGRSTATLQRPSPSDDRYLRSPMPGLAPESHLYRCIVEPCVPAAPADVLHVHTDVVISDASGSTGMSLTGGGHQLFGGPGGRTVRSEFNRQEERRFLKRFESIPLLVKNSVLRDNDVWRQVFCVFDHTVQSYWSFECRVGDVTAELVSALQALSKAGSLDTPGVDVQSRAAALSVQSKGLLESARQTMLALRALKPSGGTSFQVAAEHVASKYQAEVRALVQMRQKLWKTTFVNWDTDGGNNYGGCYKAIRELREKADVVGGFVTGVGAWVDQDCATRVARILRGPCLLSLHFPADDAQDAILRRDLHHWIQAVKTMTVTATVSAGSVSWEARHGTRQENAVDCLAAVMPGGHGADAQMPEFDLPDVSQMDHTKAVLRGLGAGRPVVLCLMSRLPFDELLSRLRIEFDVGGAASVTTANEGSSGVMLAHDWMRVLSGMGSAVQRNTHSLVPRLRQLLEDSLSFNFNLPSTSGSTARLGRAKTAHRQPVASEKQPKEPVLNLTVDMDEAWNRPESEEKEEREDEHRCRVFGGPSLGAAPTRALFGSPAAHAASLFGAPPPGGGCFGSPAPQVIAAAAAQPMAQGVGFGANARRNVANTGGGLFGASSTGGSFGAFGGKGGKGGGGLFGAPSGCAATGPVVPTRLLKNSGCLSLLNCPPGDSCQNISFQKALARIKFLVHSLGTNGAGGNAAPPAPEDPLVGQLLGAGAPPIPQAVRHEGFQCDGCGALPISGRRHRSITAEDWDFCGACYAADPRVCEHAFVSMDEDRGLKVVRHSLKVLFKWLPLLPAVAAVPAQLQGVDLESMPGPALLACAQQLFGSA